MSELFIHSLRFSQNADLVAEAPCCLSTEEQARAARFKVETARQDFLVSHYLLRQTLCRYLRTDARSINYRYGEHGKPFLDAPASQNLNFSLSHSGDRLLIAVCRGGQIGVDIERVQERSDPMQLASHFMSGDETMQLARLIDPETVKLARSIHCPDGWTPTKALSHATAEMRKYEKKLFGNDRPLPELCRKASWHMNTMYMKGDIH